jgi:hypothetical protein
MDPKTLKNGAVVVQGEYMLFHDGLVLQTPGGQWVRVRRMEGFWRAEGLEVRGFEPLTFSLRTRRSTN